jgi:CO/xanthine dehydrogenase Mo-binding subunit
MAGKLNIIGKPERRVDAWGKVTGKAKYAEDYNITHQLWGKVLRSKYPHAKVLSIDVVSFPALKPS